jgi:hypothetical protein
VQRLVPVLALAAVTGAAAAPASAGGCPPLSCGVGANAAFGGSLLTLRPDGDHGQLLAYDLASRRVRFRLPPGVLSADGRRFFATRTLHGRTSVTTYDARAGRRTGVWVVPGRWYLARTSADGRWLALVRAGHQTSFALVDAARRRVVHRWRLARHWDVDAVPRDGRRVYLIQWFSTNGPAKYAVRTYDFARGRVDDVPLKADTQGMLGFPWTAVATPDGRKLLTLYLNLDKGTAFVHALDLRHGTATCIDLPGREAAYARLTDYSLALARDGRSLYVANPARGVVQRLDLVHGRIARTVRFAPATPGPPAAAAVSLDGRRVAFAGANAVFVYDTRGAKVRGPLDARGDVAGLAFDRRGRLVVVHGDRQSLTLH